MWRDSEGNILASNNGTEDNNYVVLQFINVQRNLSGVYECIAYDQIVIYSGTTMLYIQCKYW